MTLTVPRRLTIPRLEPGSEAWCTQPYVSASYASVLFGLHPFCSMRDLWLMRKGEHRDDAGEAAETGNEMEPWIAERWATRNGVTVYSPTLTYVAGPISANPDRLIVGCKDTILQVKATSKPEGPVPSSHYWQVQAEMLATGADKAVLAYFFGGSMCFREHTIGRDEGAIAQLVERAEHFLACLDLDIEPEVIGRDAEPERTVEVGALEAALCRELRFYRTAAEESKAEADKIRLELDALLGGPGLVAGDRLVLTHEGERLLRLRRQRGRVKQVADPSGERSADFSVMEAV